MWGALKLELYEMWVQLRTTHLRGIPSYLGPRCSAEHSLRFRDSALAGSDELSPTPLILTAYQRLEIEHKQVTKYKCMTNV